MAIPGIAGRTPEFPNYRPLTKPVIRRLLFKFRECSGANNLTRGESMKTTIMLAIAALVPGLFMMQASGGSSVA
ncbi:MAG TPA: hypothetical protein VKY31_09500, partial [Terriglobia bacterium]|nr:hypothetical protein [Terriglobia bacterium]